MIARTSGVFNGLLIEQLISWFPELGPADIKFLETIIEHRLPPRIHTRTLVAAAVRKLRSEGRLLAVFSNLQNIQDKKTREFPVMMERWTKFFDVNIF